jgi:peptidoglycan/xylan/chitin deacetylase (PgdA/CDA1 family)
LNTLKTNNAKATFFVNGLNYDCIYNQADIIKRIVNEGHQIASHTWSHADLTTLTAAQIKTEMDKLDAALLKIAGVAPRYMRPPYGSLNDAVRLTLGQLGYKIVLWDVDSEDSLGATAAQSKSIIDANSNFPAPHILLMHDTHSTTVNDVAPYAMTTLKNKGYNLMTVGQCVGDGTSANWYKKTGTPGVRDSTWVC